MSTVAAAPSETTVGMAVGSPGPQTSVQDGGRPGYLGRGIPIAGAQDHYALAMANVIVGNPHSPAALSLGDPGAAGLEFAIMGPKLRFDRDVTIAITGGGCSPTVDKQPIPTWQAVRVPAGALLNVGRIETGARGYLAVDGGLDVPPFLGSRSTYIRGGIGGFEGRILRKGDHVPLGPPTPDAERVVGRSVVPDAIPDYATIRPLRVLLGPEDDLFEDAAIEAFLGEPWRMSPVADRMGFRTEGPALTFKPRAPEVERDAGSNPSNIVDNVTPLGGIQVPTSGSAIVMGVELGSAGGYAKIATLIMADMGRVGQLRPGDEFRFQAVTLDEAVAADREQRAALSAASLTVPVA